MQSLHLKQMGVSESTFKNTSIRFIREGSPIDTFVNGVVLEDKKDNIQMVKEQKGTFRPYLVIYNKLLHAKTAMYMTSSLPESRIEAENHIWGHHLVKTPQKLYNYIDVSALKGGLSDKSRISVIDRDRFLFITDDSLVELTSRAVGAEDLLLSKTSHYTNIDKIASALEKDFPPEYTEGIVRQGATQRWTYLLKDAQPVLYNPSINYLALYINAGLKFNNNGYKLTPEELALRQKTMLSAIKAYNQYAEHLEKLERLNQTDPRLYSAYKNAKYYTYLITDRTYNKMWEADHAKNGEGWKYLVGKPRGQYGKMSFEDRLIETMEREKISGKTATKKKEALLELLEEEKRVQKSLSKAVNSVIEDVNRVKRENIDLSSYVFEPESVYKVTKNIEQAKTEIEKKYAKLALEFENEFQKRSAKIKERKAKETLKASEQEYQALANEYALLELKKSLERIYFGLFSNSYKQFAQDTLIPKEATILEFKKLVLSPDEIKSFNEAEGKENLLIGNSLNKKIDRDLGALALLSQRAEASIIGLEEAVQDIKQLSKTEEVTLLNELFMLLYQEMQKRQISASTKGEKVNPKQVLKELLNLEENPQVVKYLGVDLTIGSNEREFLSSLQTIVNFKADLRALCAIKETREEIKEKLLMVNSPDLTTKYAETLEIINSLDKDYFKQNNLKRPKEIAEISNEVDALKELLTSKKATRKDYEKVTGKLDEIIKEMEAMANGYQEQRKQKAYYEGALIAYDYIKDSTIKKLPKMLDGVYLKVIDHLKNSSNVLEQEEFMEADRVIMRDKKGNEMFNLTREQIQQGEKNFTKANQNCFDVNNFSDPQKTQELIEAVYNKCFPDTKVLTEFVQSRVKKAKSPKQAAEIYKSHATMIRTLKQDFDGFMEKTMQTVYNALCMNQENLVLLNNFDLMIGIMGADLRSFMDEQYLESGEDVDGEQEVVTKALHQGERDLKLKAKSDFKDYTQNVYNNLTEVVNSLPPRSDLNIPIQDYLRTRRPGKLRTINNAIMPQSILGGNGLEESMQAVLAQKRNHTLILSELVTGQEVHSDSVYQNVLSCTAGFIKSYTDKAREEVDKKFKQNYKQNMIETIRLFALENSANENFLNKKNYLPRLMEIYTGTTKNKRSGSVDKFTKGFAQAVKETVDILNSDQRMVKQGEYDETIDHMLRKLVSIYNKSIGEIESE